MGIIELCGLGIVIFVTGYGMFLAFKGELGIQVRDNKKRYLKMIPTNDLRYNYLDKEEQNEYWDRQPLPTKPLHLIDQKIKDYYDL